MDTKIWTWEDLKEAKQDWKSVRYDYDTRTWIYRPVFYLKYKWSNRFERISIKEAMSLVGTIFNPSEQLREWIEKSKYSHVLDKIKN
ncbi:hypothetical protein [Tenacibaculum ovolyticum]|uniref:hypothetical protein n=1 Tax=Tenacibaculum ovolyticum TaxID=104270 RepID=UPI0007ED4DE4|nr:hypothetical protein [Tenacibaculum ovolyticum]